MMLALVLVLSLAACKPNEEDDPEGTPAQTPNETPAETPEETPAETPNDKIEFEPCDETVYAYDVPYGLWLRSSTDFDSEDNKVKYITEGTELKRIGNQITNSPEEVSEWSKVIYEGVEYFCASNCLTTVADEDVTLENVDEIVIINTETPNIYSRPYKAWSVEAPRFRVPDVKLAQGTEVKRTGIYYADENDPEVGWSRIEYNEKTYYIRNSVLTLKEVKLPTVTELLATINAYYANSTSMNVTGHAIEKYISADNAVEEYKTDMVLKILGLGSENVSMNMSMLSDGSGMSFIIVDGTAYITMADSGVEMKMKTTKNISELMSDASDITSGLTIEEKMFISAEVEFSDGNYVLNVKGLTKEAFIEYALGLTPDLFESEQEYNDTLALYTFDNEKDYTMTLVVDLSGNLVSATEMIAYECEGVDTVCTDVMNFSAEVPVITVPEDADSYMDIDSMQ